MTNKELEDVPPIVEISDLDASPHEIYKAYRERLPFIRRSDGAFLILRHSDISVLPNDPRTRQPETELLAVRGIKDGPLFDFFSRSMLFSNGEVHRRRRRPFTREFAFKMIEAIRPEVRRHIFRLTTSNGRDRRLRIRDELAGPVPALTIASILGVDPSEVPFFTSLAYEVSKTLSPSWGADERPGMERAAAELTQFVSDLLTDRVRSPKDDFLSLYLQEVDFEDAEARLDAIMQIVTIVLGGSDTTRAAIVIQTGLLLQERQRWDAVRQDRTLLHGAVAESLRFEPAVGSFPRIAMAEIELDGHTIPAGSLLILSTVSSMRDPAVYDEPDLFDLRRKQQRWHPVFGVGEHRCLGEALARMELEETLAALLELYPGLGLMSDGLTVHGHAGIRRVDELEVVW